MPRKARMTARKPRAGEGVSKERELGCGGWWLVTELLDGRIEVGRTTEGWEETYQAHRLAQELDHRLVGHGVWVGEEEEGQGDVEEAEGGEDGFCGYERHGWGSWGCCSGRGCCVVVVA